MHIRPGMMAAAAKAFRNACEEGQDTTYAHKFDCRVRWDKQTIEVTDETGTVAIDFRHPSLMAAVEAAK